MEGKTRGKIEGMIGSEKRSRREGKKLNKVVDKKRSSWWMK